MTMWQRPSDERLADYDRFAAHRPDSYGQTELVIVPSAADVVDPLHHVPLHAPLAQALLDHHVGDQVRVRLLTGTQVLRIVAVC